MRTINEVGKQVTLVLRDSNQPPSTANGDSNSNQDWSSHDILLARIPIDSKQPGGYICPCANGNRAANAGNCQWDAQCADGPCCTDPACADGGFEFYYVEFERSPVPGDYPSYGGLDLTGVTIRLGGGLHDCMSTRLVVTHVIGGVTNYVMNRPDPQGKLAGSWFEDPVRRVIIRLDGMGGDWAQVSILRY